MGSFACQCRQCRKYFKAELTPRSEARCPHCGRAYPIGTLTADFESCPLCGGKQFYVQKDFNQALGFLILAVGIILVPATYGLSLAVVALIDWILYTRLPMMVICYQCEAEFRGIPPPQRLKPFMHHIGQKYDERRRKGSGQTRN